MKTALRTLLLGLSATALLAACIIPIAPGARFYVLNPQDRTTMVPNHAPPGLHVEISSLELPAYLDRPEVVFRTTDEQLQLSEQDHWAGDLDENIKRVLAKNLSLLLQTPDVSVAPHLHPRRPDYRVRVQILQFERGADQRVRLAAQWQISMGKERSLLVSKLSELSSDVLPTEPTLNTTVAVMSRLLADLSSRISAAIAQHAGSRVPS